MKPIKFTIFVCLILALIWPVTAFAKDNFDDRVVFGGTFTLESGETHLGSLVIFGGAVTTESDSTVNGDVVLIGGTIELGGTVNGNVVGIGGAVRLTETAEINGDVVTIGATLRREDGALITGQVVNGLSIPFTNINPKILDGSQFVPPEIPEVPEIPEIIQTPQVTVNTNPILEIIWFFFRTFLYAALAVLLVMFLQTHVTRVANAAITQPVITAGAGLLTAVLAPLALVIITITIILIPVTLVTVLLLAAAWLLGWVALGYEIGRRIGKSLNVEWAPAISAGLGTFILVFVLGGFSKLVPCIGWLPQTLVGLWGLGAVLMTRFGTQEYLSDNQSSVVDATEQLPPALAETEVSGDAEPAQTGPAEEGEPIPDDGLSSADDLSSADGLSAADGLGSDQEPKDEGA